MYAEYRIYAFYQYENSHSLRYSHNQSFWHVMPCLKFHIGQNTEVTKPAFTVFKFLLFFDFCWWKRKMCVYFFCCKDTVGQKNGHFGHTWSLPIGRGGWAWLINKLIASQKFCPQEKLCSIICSRRFVFSACFMLFDKRKKAKPCQGGYTWYLLLPCQSAAVWW